MSNNKLSAFYIHIPFCIKKCKYCDFTSYENYDTKDAYFDALVKEIEMQKDTFADYTFDTVFFGGGTPSSVEAGYIKRVMDAINKNYTTDLAEVTIEANPGTVDEEKLKAYLDMGINRISFGVQATQDRLLQKIGRIHTFSEAEASVRLAQDVGFHNISCDIMSGLPMQKESDLIESVVMLSDLDITHMSMYTLKLEEGTPLYNEVMGAKTFLMPSDKEWEMSKKARQELSAMGFARYEISNYAKRGYECKHNLHYWHNDDFLGVGVSASSAKNGLRTTNVKDINEYIKKISDNVIPTEEKHQSTDEEYAFEKLMLELRLKRGIDKNEYKTRHGIDLDERFNDLIDSLKNRGLIISTADSIRLTDFGMDIQNSILVEFMNEFDF